MELNPHSFLSLETSSEDLPSKSAYINASAQQYEQHRRWLCANVAQVILWRKENKPWDISKMAKWDEHCGKRSIDDFANPVSFQAWQANMSKVFGSVKKDYRSVHNSTNNAAELKTDGSGSGSPKLSYKPTKKERKNKNYYDVGHSFLAKQPGWKHGNYCSKSSSGLTILDSGTTSPRWNLADHNIAD